MGAASAPQRTKRKGTSAAPIVVGGLFTFVVLGVAFRAGFGEVCQDGTCTPKWKVFLNSTPAEIGDALSGVGSVLAFIWVIVTVWMQLIELGLQREEMRDQQAETAKMAEAMKEQAEIFKREQKERDEDRADKELDALVDRFLSDFRDLDNWAAGTGTLMTEMPVGNDEDEIFGQSLHALIRAANKEKSRIAHAGKRTPARVVDPSPAEHSVRYLRRIAKIRPRLTPARQIWHTKFRVPAALESLEWLLAQPQLWDRPVRKEGSA